MLITMQELMDRHIRKHRAVSGVLHVGCHLAEEAPAYAQQGIENVVWVEGNPVLIEQIQRILNNFRGQRIVEALVSEFDGDEVTFHITDDPEHTAMSSSILELELHKKHAPWVVEVEQKKLHTKTIDTLVFEHEIRDCNFINLDIQGAELLALKGATNFLETCDYVYTEVNINYLYKDCVLLPELDQFLGHWGFQRLDTIMTPAEWGDAFYVKQGS